jgi:indolepyruvate ferredoxin oxidoreductase beta subunit
VSRAKRKASSAGSAVGRKVADILVVGVGGQGVIMAAAIIADTALLHGGLQVKLIETHGMSQRGGGVQSQIRIGPKVVAPVISPGEVDFLLAFEAAEGLRLAPSLTADGVAVVNTRQIVPPLASYGDFAYPFDALERLRAQGRNVLPVDGDAVAEEVGDVKVAGVVLVGALSTHLPFAVEIWRQAIAKNVPASWLEPNLAAFAAGRKVGDAACAGKVAADARTAGAAAENAEGGADKREGGADKREGGLRA